MIQMTLNSSLYERLALAETENKYFEKDRKKAQGATKFIGRGSSASSTSRYMLAAGDLANCGAYNAEDRVFVSVEGNRKGRIPLDLDEILLAVRAGATFIADNKYDRERPYNIGERQLCAYLESHNYVETGPGIWSPGTSSREDAMVPVTTSEPNQAKGFERLRKKL